MALGEINWIVRYQIYRRQNDQPATFQDYLVLVDPEEHVLDGLERIWAYQDRTLMFQHACHHAMCGSCGMLVNGVEKLTCITKINELVGDGGTLRLEPLRNFPIIGDLVVDRSRLFNTLQDVGEKQVYTLAEAPLGEGIKRSVRPGTEQEMRLGDCIECGLCVSACPIAGTDPDYLGPAVLTAIHFQGKGRSPQMQPLIDSAQGIWRCHSAFDCSAVCPGDLDPSARIMDLRKQTITQRIFG